MGYKWTLKDRLGHLFFRSVADKPPYVVPDDVGEAKRAALGHVARLEDCYSQRYGSGTNNVHDLDYTGLKRIAGRHPRHFARWIADGEIPVEFLPVLAIRGGSAHPLLPGVLDILLDTEIVDVRHEAEWLDMIYVEHGYTR